MPTGDKMLIEKDKKRPLIVWLEPSKEKLELKNISWSEMQNIQEKIEEKW